MNLGATLDQCLRQIEAGESIESCLARYPGQAAELAPMLAAAVQLQAMSRQALTAAQSARAKNSLRQAVAAQQINSRSRRWTAPLGGIQRLAAVAAVALLLVVVLSVSAVASSQPGSAAYAVRVVAERAPALVQINPVERTSSELSLADRRLADLQAHLTRAGRLEPAALRALLASDRAAAQQAVRAGRQERLETARRLAVHARLLATMANTTNDPRAAQLLREAAQQTMTLAERLRTPPAIETGGQADDRPPVPLATNTASATSTATPSDTLTSTPTATATATRTATATATASPTASSTETPTTVAAGAAVQSPPPGETSAPPAATATNTVDPKTTPRPTRTPRPKPGPSGTPVPTPTERPRPRQTAMAQTATAAAQQTALAPTETPKPTRRPDDPSEPSPWPSRTPRPTPTRPRR